jgi:tail length tape measure protein
VVGERSVTFTLKLDSSDLKPGSKEAKASLDDLGKAGQESGKKASDGLNGAASSAGTFNQAAEKAARSAAGLAAGTSQVGQAAANAAVSAAALSGVVGLLAVGTITLVAAWAKGQAQIDGFNRSLATSGNIAGKTALDLAAMTSAIGAQTGAYRSAETALNKAAAGGRLAGEGLQFAARAAVSLSEITGESVASTVAEFEKLADNPVKSVLKLNDQYHFLTLAVYDQIKALQDQGKEQAATDLALEAAANAFEKRRVQIVENAGLIARAFKEAKDFVLDLGDALANIGKDSTIQSQLDALYAQRAVAHDKIKQLENPSFGSFGSLLPQSFKTDRVGSLIEDTKAIDDQIAKLREQQSAQDGVNRTAAEQGQAEQGRIKAAADIDSISSSLDKQYQKQQAINQLNANFSKLVGSGDPRAQGVTQDDAGNLSGGLYDTLLGDINKKYAEHSTAARDAAKAEREFEQAVRVQQAAMESLQSSTEALNGKIDPMEKVWGDYADALRKAAEDGGLAIQANDKLGEQGVSLASIQAAVAANVQAATAVFARQTSEIAKQGDVLGTYLKKVSDQRALAGMTERQRSIAEAVKQVTDEYKKNADAGVKMKDSLEDVAAGAETAAAALYDTQKSASDVESIVSQFGQKSDYDQIVDNLALVEAAIKKTWDPKLLLPMILAQERLNAMQEQQNIGLMQEGVSSLQKFAKEGTAAYTALGIAQDVLAYKSAISAIANQGSGDPYSAFARIAAMIALMASIGIRIGGGGGGGGGPSAQSAEVRQEHQGTGSVLGDTEAKSESIRKSIEITANAAEQLVGLNRGMLTALQALQSALGAAGNQLARGAGDAGFRPITADAGFLSSVFGGDQSVIDQGIIIAGGRLNDMLNSIVVGAYQTVQTDGGWFGSDGTSDQLVDISDEFGKQFQLVIKSIADTVREGALALGLLPADIDAAIAAFKVEETRISLEGLSGEDQQKEIEAVFSKIFDGLAGAVVPFIGQFQKVGEGLGETLVRVATEVQVAQEAFKQLGLAVDEADPEKFAQISDALIQAAGGLDSFISGMQSFVSNFASDGQKFQVAFDALTSAFDQVGLTVPKTRDAMWKLMQSLDATTVEGREQIATLLRLSDVADDYYDMLDEQARALAAAIQNGRELVDELYGAGTLDDVNRQIAELEAYSNSASSAVGGFGRAMTDTAAAATRAMDLLLGNLSPLNDQEKLQTALAGLRAGTATQEQVLEIGRRLYASSQAYVDLFNTVQAIGVRGGGNVGGAAAPEKPRPTTTLSLEELIARRDEMQAAERSQNARDLADIVAQLAEAQKQSYTQVSDLLHFNLSDLADDLGLSNDELTTYLDNLRAQQTAIPDSITTNADRQIRAMYDIAGRQIPDFLVPDDYTNGTAPGSDFAARGHSGHANPRYTDDSYTVMDTAVVSRGTVAGASTNADMVAAVRASNDKLDAILRAVRDSGDGIVVAVGGVGAATREVERALRARGSGGSRGTAPPRSP